MCAWEFAKTPRSTSNSILLSGTQGGLVFQCWAIRRQQWKKLESNKGLQWYTRCTALPPPSSGVNMECYFWCTSGAGVQLYFTLLWRCTKRQLWVESLDHLPNAAPQQNLGWKIKKEKHVRRGVQTLLRLQLPVSVSSSLSAKENKTVTLSFLLFPAQMPPDQQQMWTQPPWLQAARSPPSAETFTPGAILDTLCCEHLNFTHRSKGVQRKKIVCCSVSLWEAWWGQVSFAVWGGCLNIWWELPETWKCCFFFFFFLIFLRRKMWEDHRGFVPGGA